MSPFADVNRFPPGCTSLFPLRTKATITPWIAKSAQVTLRRVMPGGLLCGWVLSSRAAGVLPTRPIAQRGGGWLAHLLGVIVMVTSLVLKHKRMKA